jgi:hypothetical protein
MTCTRPVRAGLCFLVTRQPRGGLADEELWCGGVLAHAEEQAGGMKSSRGGGVCLRIVATPWMEYKQASLVREDSRNA